MEPGPRGQHELKLDAQKADSNETGIPKTLGQFMLGMLEAAATMAAVSVGLGFLGGLHYLFDLLSHFRLQSTICITFAAIVLCSFRRRTGIWCALIAAMLIASLAPNLLRRSTTAPSSSYRLLALNVLRHNQRTSDVVDLIRNEDPDFFILQETDSRWIKAIDKTLGSQWPHRTTAPSENNFGIAFYSKFACHSCEIKQFGRQFVTPSIDARIDLPEGQLRILGTHTVPPMSPSNWSERNRMMLEIAKEVRANSANTIVAGDLNCTPWSHWFNHFLRESNLRDSADGFSLQTTWRPTQNALIGLPIDHALVGENISISRRHVGPDVGSDHRAVILDFNLLPAD